MHSTDQTMGKTGKKKGSGKLILILLGVVILLIILVIAFKGDETVTVFTEKAEKRTIIASISESGTVQPSVELKIQPDVSGEIVFVGFREGQKVKTGDLLVTIKPENYKAALDQAKASLNAAKAQWYQSSEQTTQARENFRLDSINYGRNILLFSSKAISRNELENSELKMSSSQVAYASSLQAERAAYYQMMSSEASMTQSQENLNKTNIYATMAGTVTKMNKEVGERAVGSIQSEGSEIMRVADLSRMEVEVEINEKDIRTIRLGDSAIVELDAFEDRKFKGKVSEIAYSASTEMGTSANDQITNFKVKVEILRESYVNIPEVMKNLGPDENPFRPGMSAQVEIFTERKEGVIAVPIAAVAGMKKEEKKDEKAEEEEEVSKEVVFVYTGDGTAKETEVETGITDDTYIEILSGLNAGEMIVTGPYLTLTKELEDGMAVVVQSKPEKKKKGDEEEEEEE